MKKYIGILTLLICCVSCEFLELKNPNQEDTGTYWTTEKHIVDGINAAYRPLRFNGEFRRWYHVLMVSRSDEGFSTSPNTTFQAYSNFQIGSYNNDGAEGIVFPWLDTYKGIFWANQVLDNAPNVEMDETKKERIIGEAYFLRGLQYFMIGAIWHRGPESLTSFAREEAPVILDQAGLYNRAILDFEEAAKRLPITYDMPADNGRVTKGGALGLLVKVYAQTHNWDKVLEISDEIFALNKYSLISNYEENFNSTNENNSESLFEIQFASGTMSGIELGSDRAKFLGFVADGIAFDDATASNWITTDLSKENTSSGAADPRLKATVFWYNQDASLQIYGKTWDQWGAAKKVFWKKYTNYANQTYEDFNSGINFRLVRLSDIYLMYAEALNETGRTAECYTWINKVRNRAGLVNLENSLVFTNIGTDKVKMHEQIEHERVCELTGEFWRWLDLERWGYFEDDTKLSRLKQRDSDFNNFVKGVNNRMPIPYREIPLIEGIQQNPGY